MNIGDKIMYLRRKADLTQEKLAEKIGVSSKTLQHWEAGKYTPKTESIRNIAQALNVPVSELLDDSSVPSADYQLLQSSSQPAPENALVYEWEGHRVALPNTPETRELFREIVLSLKPAPVTV